MMHLLTEKLKTQSLVDVLEQDLDETDHVEDADRDSGTESGDENVELQELECDLKDMTSTKRMTLSSYNTENLSAVTARSREMSPNPEVSDSLTLTMTCDDLSSSSDFECCTSELDHNSSEEELSVIENEKQRCLRETLNERLENCDSVASVDKEVQELMLPLPAEFCSSPPLSITERPPHTLSHVAGSDQMLYVTGKENISVVSPRKRTRQISLSESPEDFLGNGAQRPCLDFEKMQKTIVKRKCSHSVTRTRVVKVQAVNTSSTERSRYLYNPEVYTFRAITMSPFGQVTAVESASCAF